ncbi:YHYH domain-containing protein [Acidovorax sp. ACV02]|nr:YHYH domain-containing protein [Acidovorax sp. ACV02]MBL7088317.1 YHYH domain-containing protein [Acidovorax sp.]
MQMKTLIALLALCATVAVHAHSGGTDKQGCHMDSKTGIRHCH